MQNLVSIISYTCIGIGLFFWFWGTSHLVSNKSVLFKLHGLTVADTLGSMLMIVGILMQIPTKWPLLVLGIISLAMWNTMLGYVIAYCSTHDTTIEAENE